MLNASFSIWAMTSQQLSFELGAIEEDGEAKSNPPSMTGEWEYHDGNTITRIKIDHFRYSSVENVHFFRFKYPPSKLTYSGNIVNYDLNSDRFELYLYEEGDDDIRTDKSLKGWMDSNGSSIKWTNMDIDGNMRTSTDIFWSGKELKWPKHELPRSRGCYNFGPLNSYETKTVEQVCPIKPEFGIYDGTKYEFTANETQELDRRLNEEESACPICDIKEQHLAYYACLKRFESMQAEASRCQQILGGSGIGTMIDAVTGLCSARLQICVRFRSATFTVHKIELCPIPTIRIIKDSVDGYEGISDVEFPDSNPVIFGCIDFPVTSGLIGQMNPRQASKFVVAGKRAEIAWYIEVWEWTKIALFTIGGILFIRWLLKKPPKQDIQHPDYEQFDDAKFFEEYGEFYSDESSEQESTEELYKDMF